MLRRKKQKNSLNGKNTFSYKFIPVFFNQEEKNSPYLLNLPEKLTPPPSPVWQPTQLDRILSNPLGELNKSDKEKNNQPTVKIDLKLELPQEPFWQKIPWPEWHFTWPKLPKFKIAKTKRIKPAPQLKIEYHAPLNVSYRLPSWQKTIASFTVVAILLVLPIKAFSAYYILRDSQTSIINSGTDAFQHLDLGQKAMQQSDFGKATQELQSSLSSFAEAQSQLNAIHPLWRSLLYIVPVIGDKLKNGEELMLSGSNLALGSLPILYLLTEKNQSGLSLTKIRDVLNEAAPRFAETSQRLMRVNPDYLPQENTEAFLKIREAIFLLNNDLQKIASLSQNLLAAAGVGEEKTYLLIFQNNNELRATGGFIGSFGEIKIKNGKITKIDIPGQGSYALQGNQTVNLIPPAPLQLLQPRWEFRDANWFPDFPTSAKKLMWIYENSGGPTVDGLIAIDTAPLIDLLKIIGPTSLPGRNLTLDADNFVETIQQEVEVNYDKTKNQPKEILSDLAPVLLEKIFNDKNSLLALLSLINKNLTEKHIQFYFSNPILEKEALTQGWGGEMKDNPSGDFLSVINTNIGGDKSDRAIEESIKHQAQISTDGSIIDTVTITRHHPGSASPFSNVKNNNYIRVYVPLGSELISATGFVWPEENNYQAPETWFKQDEDLKKIEETQNLEEKSGTTIFQEAGKTVLANWMIVKPGETATASFTYRLPFTIKKPEAKNFIQLAGQFFKQNKDYSSYSLLVQKQAGSKSNALESIISWPSDWQVLWANPSPTHVEVNSSEISTKLSTDKFLGIVFENSPQP